MNLIYIYFFMWAFEKTEWLKVDNSDKDITQQLFNKERKLLQKLEESNSDLLWVAKEEFEQMKNDYNNEKNKWLKETQKNIWSITLDINKQKKLNWFIKEFRTDMVWINKISNFSELWNYDKFINLLIDNSLWNFTEEKVFTVFSKYDLEQIKNWIWDEFPIDKTWVKKMIKNIKKGIDVKKEENTISSGNNLIEKGKNKEILVGQKNEQSKIIISISNLKLEDVSKISILIVEYMNKYWDDDFIKKHKYYFNKKIKEEWVKESTKENKGVLIKQEKHLNKLLSISYISEKFPELSKALELNLEIQKLDNLDKITNKKNLLKDKISEISQERLKELFSILKKNVDKDIKKIEDSWIKIDSVEWQKKLKETKSYRDYKAIYDWFSELSPSLWNSIGKKFTSPKSLFDNYYSWEKSNTHIENWKLKVAWIDEEELKRNWDTVYSSGENWFWRIYKLSEIPPVMNSIVEKTSYSLEMELPDISKELDYDRRVLSEKIWTIDKSIDKKKVSLEARKKDLARKKENWEDTAEIEATIERLEIEIEWLEKDKKISYKEFEKKLDIYKEEFENKIEQKEKTQKDTLVFLWEIGFDLIPQDITDHLIEMININPSLYWFDTKIDLSNWELWFSTLDSRWLDINNKKRFLKSIMTSLWNPKDLFKEEWIINNTSVVVDTDLSLYLNQNWYKWIGAHTKMLENLLNRDSDSKEIR